jgi:hypothetical protein
MVEAITIKTRFSPKLKLFVHKKQSSDRRLKSSTHRMGQNI